MNKCIYVYILTVFFFQSDATKVNKYLEVSVSSGFLYQFYTEHYIRVISHLFRYTVPRSKYLLCDFVSMLSIGLRLFS